MELLITIILIGLCICAFAITFSVGEEKAIKKMTGENYVKEFNGDIENTIKNLEWTIELYRTSQKNQTPKTLKRVLEYERLLAEIKILNNN